MKKFLSAMLAILLVAATLTSSALATNGEYDFPDIDNTSTADAIDTLSTLGIISGYSDGKYHPENNLTRAEAATLMTRALYSSNISIVKTLPWKDVAQTHWARKYIDTAYMRSIISGYGDWYYGPEDNISYVQMLTIVLNTIGYDAGHLSGKWPDKEITQAKAVGLLDGLGIKDFDKPCTRGEAAQMIYNALDVPCAQWSGAAFTTLPYTFLEALGYTVATPTYVTEGDHAGAMVATYSTEAGEQLRTNVIVTTELPVTYRDGAWYQNNGRAIGIDGAQWFVNGKVSAPATVENGDRATLMLLNDVVKSVVYWSAKTYYPYDGLNYGNIDTSTLKNFIEGASTVTYFDTDHIYISNKTVMGIISKIRTESGNPVITMTLSDGTEVAYAVGAVNIGTYICFYYDYTGAIVGYHTLEIS